MSRMPTLRVFTPPAQDVLEIIAEFERRGGILPLSLRAFYEVVGSVNFVGTPPEAWTDWRSVPDGLDALYLYPADAEMLNDAESWEEHYGDLTEEEWDLPGEDEEDLCDSRAYYALPHDCWLVWIAPDEWHKYDISGCGGYDIAVPNPAADARLLTEWHRTDVRELPAHLLPLRGLSWVGAGRGGQAIRSSRCPG